MAIDYGQWGAEYLLESEVLKERLEHLQQKLPELGPSAAKELNYRICMLYSMYLDCLTTGKQLIAKKEADLHEAQKFVS